MERENETVAERTFREWLVAMRTLYFTHCCARKNDSLRNTESMVSPLQLYQAMPTQQFMKRCIEAEVEWAIFSDKYAFVFPHDRIEWYEKPPNSLTPNEKMKLFDKAFKVLQEYGRACFYYNPGRIHPFYIELINEMKRRGKDVREITHVDDVVK